MEREAEAVTGFSEYKELIFSLEETGQSEDRHKGRSD